MKVDEQLSADTLEFPRPAPIHLPWRIEPDPINGASVRDAKGNQIVARIYDEENAQIVVCSVNSADAAEMLYEAARAMRDVLGHTLDCPASTNQLQVLGYLATDEQDCSVRCKSLHVAIAEYEKAKETA